jgi:hypothetical protein
MPSKKFRLGPHQLEPLAKGFGSCFATDRITVDGCPVGYMYREEPASTLDSGWRFFAGDESDAYANEPSNVELYDVNTVANCDREVIPYLNSPPGSAFSRRNGGPLQPEAFQEPSHD